MPTADLPSDFWAGWIFVVTVVSVAGLAWLVYSVYFGTGADAEVVEGDEPVWDGNLREGANPAPLWWFWTMFASLAFSVLYLILYPGLGSYAGALRWSQGGSYDVGLAAYEAEFGGVRQLVAVAPLEALRADATLMAAAQRVFDRECAVCHGYDGAGQAALFPNLVDAAWQWGGAPADVERSIRDGRQAVMVGWQAVLGDAGVAGLTALSEAMHGTGQAPPPTHPAHGDYMQYCTACHGADGGGNPLLGAPSLVDAATLYGADGAAIRHSIAAGRAGEMPAFGERLDDTQVRLLVAWLTRSTEPADAAP